MEVGDVLDEFNDIVDEIDVRGRKVPVTETAKNALRDWILALLETDAPKDTPLFQDAYAKPITPDVAARFIRAAAKRCGLNGKVSSYSIRFTAKNRIYAETRRRADAGENINPGLETMKIMGARDPFLEYIDSCDYRRVA